MLRRYLESRYIAGNSSVNRLSPALDLSFMLTKLKNYSTDEYSTMDNDGMSVPPLACAFARMPQNQHVVGVVDEDGYLVLYNTHKTGKAAVVKSWQVHTNAVFDLEWLSEENKILTGSGDQTIALHDAETCQKLSIFKGHASSIKSISSKVGNDAVFASGSRDGHIMMWDRRIYQKDETASPVDTIFNAHMLQQQSVNAGKRKRHQSHLVKDAQQSVTTVLFQNENYLISSGAVDGCLKVWDLRKTYKRKTSVAQPAYVFQYPGANTRKHGYSSLVQDSQGRRLFANCTDDVIYEYDMAAYNPTPVRTWRGHKNSTFYVKSTLSPDDQYLLSGSSDEMAYIWQINNPGAAPIALKSHTAEVTTVSWCPNDLTKVVTLSDDTKIKFWRIYCRELKKQYLPKWLGHAKVISKRPETPTAIDLQTPTTSGATSSPSSLNKSTSSPQLCIRTWLKRKAQTNESQEAPRNKSFCRPGNMGAPDNATEREKARAGDNSEMLSEKTNKRPEPSLSSDDAVTNLECSSRSETLSSCSTSSPECLPKKRMHDESEDTSSSDSPVFQAPPCIKCNKDEQLNYMSEQNITAKRLKTEQDSNYKETIVNKYEPTAEDNRCHNDNFQTLLSEVNLQIPHKTTQASPSKPKISLRQDENTEPYQSPKKLLKRTSNSDESPVTSPKRQCLTSLESNGLQRNVCSVKTSLFNTPSSHMKLNSVEPFSLCTSTDEMDMKLESRVTSEVMTTSSFLSPLKTLEEFHSSTKSPPTETLKCVDNSFTKDIFTCQRLQDDDFDSPTRNLPNSVMDETCGRIAMPSKSRSIVKNQKQNWLTQIRLEKLKKNSKTVPKQTNQGKLSPKVTKGMRKINSYFK